METNFETFIPHFIEACLFWMDQITFKLLLFTSEYNVYDSTCNINMQM